MCRRAHHVDGSLGNYFTPGHENHKERLETYQGEFRNTYNSDGLEQCIMMQCSGMHAVHAKLRPRQR